MDVNSGNSAPSEWHFVVYCTLSKWLKAAIVICGSIVTQKLAQCVALILVYRRVA
jgi:uncharacterized protein involved in tolerance to divalent cations